MTQQKLSVVLVGEGQMGSLLAASIDASSDFELVGSVDVTSVGELDAEMAAADVLIDFSRPEALPHIEAYAKRTKAALVVGTTGYSTEEAARLDALASDCALVRSTNFSLGVALMKKLAREAAQVLKDYDVEIVETHHHNKVDAPSGTALSLAEAVREVRDLKLVYGREGQCGKRSENELGMHSLRGGTVAGTHELSFFGEDEEFTLTHRAASRQIFVNGALACARALAQCAPGSYNFDELVLSAL